LRSDQELQINNLPWLSNAELIGLGKSGNNIQIMKREKSAGNILFLRATYALVKKHALRMTENEEENKKGEREEKERKNEPINELNPNLDRNKKRVFEEEKEGALRMMKRSIGSIDKNNQKETEKFEMGRKQRDVNALMQKSLEEKEKSGKEIEKEIEESRRIMHRKRLDNMEKKRNNLLAQLEIENERNWGNKREYNSGGRFVKGRNDEKRRDENRNWRQKENRNGRKPERMEDEKEKQHIEKDEEERKEEKNMNSTSKWLEEKPEGKTNKQLNNSCSIVEELKKLEEIIKERNDENGKKEENKMKKNEEKISKENKSGSERESLDERLRKLKERIELGGSGTGQTVQSRYDYHRSPTPPSPEIIPLEEEPTINIDYICNCPVLADEILDRSGTNVPKVFDEIRGRPIPSIFHALCLDYQVRHHHINKWTPSYFIELPDIVITLDAFTQWVQSRSPKQLWKEEKMERILKSWMGCAHKRSAILGERRLTLNWPESAQLKQWLIPLQNRMEITIERIQLEEKMKEKAKEAVWKKEAEENEKKRQEAEAMRQNGTRRQ
jgi:hypothetical protein